MSLERILANFDALDDWEEKYAYIIKLGKGLDPMADELKTDAALVRGCMSRVWLVGGMQDGVLHLQADSDAFIVRGLVAILMAALNDQAPSDVLATDVDAIFREIGLHQHLSAGRRNGLHSMVGRIKALAAAA